MHAKSEERLNFSSWQKLCISQKGPRRSLENSQEWGLETPAARRIPTETQEGLFETGCDRRETNSELKQSWRHFLRKRRCVSFRFSMTEKKLKAGCLTGSIFRVFHTISSSVAGGKCMAMSEWLKFTRSWDNVILNKKDFTGNASLSFESCCWMLGTGHFIYLVIAWCSLTVLVSLLKLNSQHEDRRMHTQWNLQVGSALEWIHSFTN